MAWPRTRKPGGHINILRVAKCRDAWDMYLVIQLKAYWEVGTVHCTHSAATPLFFQSTIAIRLEMPQKRMRILGYGLLIYI